MLVYPYRVTYFLVPKGVFCKNNYTISWSILFMIWMAGKCFSTVVVVGGGAAGHTALETFRYNLAGLGMLSQIAN